MGRRNASGLHHAWNDPPGIQPLQKRAAPHIIDALIRSAETGDAEHSALELGERKLADYGVDLLVVNEVGADKVFGLEHTEAVIFAADGGRTPVPHGSKAVLADAVWDAVLARRTPRG